MKRWLMSFMVCTLALLPAAVLPVSHSAVAEQAVTGQQPWEWHNVNLQGMGWVTGLVTQKTAPYLMYAKTDVGGAYRYDRDKDEWIPLTDGFGLDQRYAYSVESINIDPGHPDDVYMASNGAAEVGGEIYKSTDRGATWTPTGMASHHVYMGGNDDFRTETGERLVIDPLQSEHMYFASRGDGLWEKIGSLDWKQVEGGLPTVSSCVVKAGCAGATFVAFDAASGTSPTGGTKIFYVGVYGTGIYKTMDGGQSFALMGYPSGGEKKFNRAVVNENGNLFVSDGNTVLRAGRSDSSASKVLDSANFSNVNFKGIVGIDVKPDEPATLYAQASDSDAGNAWMYESVDEGATWQAKQQMKVQEPAYYPSWWSNHERAGLVVDPIDPTVGWTTTGFGILKLTGINTNTPKAAANMKGVEELVGYNAKVPPLAGGFDVHVGAADSAGFSVRDRDTVPATRLMSQRYDGPPMYGINLTQMSGLDYSYQKPNYMAYTGYHQFSLWNGEPYHFFGTTSDGGRTWNETAKKATLDTIGGMIAMSSTNPANLVWSPYNGYLKYSTDSGQTWQDASGSYSENNTHGHLYERSSTWWSATQNVVSDKVNGQKFYMFTERNALTAEFYMSTDGGKTWNLTYTGFQAKEGEDFSSPNPQHLVNFAALPFTNVKVNPTKEGDVFLVSKPGDFPDDRATVYPKLYRSTDVSVSQFVEVPNVQGAVDVAFGKGDLPDQPYIYLYGKANGDTESGVYVSKDNGATWTCITNPQQTFGRINQLEADMRYPNRVYMALSGRGFVYGQLADQPDVNVTSVTGDQALVNPIQDARVYHAGTNVTIQAAATAKQGATIRKVEFFAGDRKLGEDTTAPYSLTLNQLAVGNYNIVAKATDSNGLEQFSSPQDFYVRQYSELGEITYKNELGERVSDLQAGQTVEVNASLSSTSKDDHGVRLIAGLEDRSGQLVQLAQTEAKLQGSGKAVYSVKIKLPAQIDGLQLKVYVSDDGYHGAVTPVSTLPDTMAPTWPDTAKLYYSERTSHSVKLYWPDAEDGFGVASYAVYQEGRVEPVAVLTEPAQAHQVIINGLLPATSYHFKVVAQDAAGNASAPLAAADLTTKASASGGDSTVPNQGNPTGNAANNSGPSVVVKQKPALSNGQAQVEFTLQAIQDSLNNRKDAQLILEASQVDGAKDIEVTFPSELFLPANGHEKAIIIQTQFASFTLPTSFLGDKLANGQKIELTIRPSDLTQWSGQIANKVDGRPMVDLSLRVNGDDVSHFQLPIQIAIPYSLRANEHANTVVGNYLTQDGKDEIIKDSYYNEAAGQLIIHVNHFSSYAVVVPEVTFADVKDVPWATEAIDGLAVRGIIEGIGDHQFDPDRNVTRAEYVQMLVHALDFRTDTTVKSSFLDTQPEDWYYQAVAAAEKLGILTGYEDGSFGANQVVTREDMAVMTARALRVAKLEPPMSKDNVEFKDQNQVADYAKSDVVWLAAAGLIHGIGENSYAPRYNTTRAQAAVLMYEVWKNKVRDSSVSK
ncbi:S-layer homology domain-containing protein [Paenibacillus pectinilyticus]|nr:S-layer homology domain-containing protein [Paenibacillus pectinilyticus]